MTVVRIPGHPISIECGTDVQRAEAENMRYIAEHTTIPVQKVFGAYEEDSVTFLFLEHISARSLDDILDDMFEPEKKHIADQLADVFSQLCGLWASYIGLVGRRPCNDVMFDDTSGGPFQSEREMNEIIVNY